MLTLLMMPMTLVNQAVMTFGLYMMRTSRSTGDRWQTLRMRKKILDFGHDDLLRIAGAEAALHHHGRVHVDLKLRISAAEYVALEVRRNVDYKGIFADVHQRNDITFGNLLRRVEVRRQKGAGNPA